MSDIKIEQALNGYIVTNTNVPYGKSIYKTLEELFTALLLQFEGRARSFSRMSYGEVTITRGTTDWPPVPDTGKG